MQHLSEAEAQLRVPVGRRGRLHLTNVQRRAMPPRNIELRVVRHSRRQRLKAKLEQPVCEVVLQVRMGLCCPVELVWVDLERLTASPGKGRNSPRVRGARLGGRRGRA